MFNYVSITPKASVTKQNSKFSRRLYFINLLGGLPPFLGFLPKWIVIQAIITNNMAPLATVVVVTSLITLYYYLKISYSSFIILNTEPKWNLKSNKNKSTKRIWALILSSISLTGIAACTITHSRKPFVRQTVLRKLAKFHMSFMYLHLHLTDKTNIQFVQRIFVRHATQHFIQTMQLVSVKKNENGETWLSHVTLFCALWANKV